MKKYMSVMILITIGIVGWSTTVNANENIIDLGTMNYADGYEFKSYPNINGTEKVDLVFLASELNESALDIYNDGFYPTENMTLYIFTAKRIYPDFWFVPEIKRFLYMDNNTGQTYKINVDYSDIEIPPDPVIKIQNKYNLLKIDYYITYDLYNATLIIYNTTREELQRVELIYNQSKQDFDNNSALVKTLKEELTAKGIKFNETSVLWIDAVSNVSILETYLGNLNKGYNILEKKHNDLAGIYPVYIFFAILITSMILIVYFKRKKIFGVEEKTDIEIERDTGYSPRASKIDKFTAGIVDIIKPKNKEQKPEASQLETKPVVPITEPKQKIDDRYKEIDELIHNHDVFQTTTVQDIQNIRGRVDVIETKLKIRV